MGPGHILPTTCNEPMGPGHILPRTCNKPMGPSLSQVITHDNPPEKTIRHLMRSSTSIPADFL